MCFSLLWLIQTLVWIVVVAAVVAILYLVVPYLLNMLGIASGVVMQVITRSTADSRRNRMPSSRATFLISEVGRFARISSRIRSVRSSSSQIAKRPLYPVPLHSMQPTPS